MHPSVALFIPIFTSFAAAATTASATSTLVPDHSAIFSAELFTTNANCNRTGAFKSFLYSRGSCQNFAIPGAGSARVDYNERPKELTLTGWTEADCKGRAVPFGTVVGLCVPLNGTAIASWSD
ncbi:uncharacterized protein F4807DRAFT_456178 [Annulohypoxylon truncatum]|uniref:uncharacterized protein n=1 Tax=Annulohypoxylon truncatum TaxID=327061 RepID=UPI0020089DE3|nr:uncharacterized protein F4807DRAFT_456178 [Annulohypoxylon truncatum]KAI1213629.1 hypothetical protein F4807DRAFT_456178 [Annulohypoxylon truncatum]